MTALTEEEQAAYRADGFVIRRNQFAQSLMAASTARWISQRGITGGCQY